MNNLSVFALMALVPFAGPAAAAPAAEKASTYSQTIRPFFEQHCFSCHGDSAAKAGVRLDLLPAELAAADAARLWTKVLEQLEAGQMPPKKKPPAVTGRSKTSRLLDQ